MRLTLFPLLVLIASLPASAQEPTSAAAPPSDARFVGFDSDADAFLIGARLGDQIHAFQGPGRRPLDVAEFFDAVSEPGRAANRRFRVRLKISLAVAAAVLGATSAALLIADRALGIREGAPSHFYGDDGCVTSNASGCVLVDYGVDYRLTGTGVGLAVLAVVTGLAAGIIDSGGLTTSEARQLAEHHNRAVTGRPGMPEPSARSSAREAPGRELAILPEISAHAAGLTLHLIF